MPRTTLTAREFNQDTGRAKRAAEDGPVFITDRGAPSHVLLSITTYEHLARRRGSIVDRLSDPAAAEIDIEFPKIVIGLKIPDFD